MSMEGGKMDNFTQIQNEIIRTDKLDVYQKSCINNILSNDERFNVSLTVLAKRIPCSRDKCIKTINSLKGLNIVSVNKIKTLNGDWDSNYYKVNLNELLKYIGVVVEKDNVVFNKDYVVYEEDNGSISQIPQVVVEKDTKNTNKNTNIEYIDLTFIDDVIDKVKITQEQYNKLINKFDVDLVNNQILALDNYIANGKGKKYKDHYRVLNTWCNNNQSKQLKITTKADSNGIRF